ncbi:EamA family transporter, partial [Marinomonas arenicola]
LPFLKLRQIEAKSAFLLLICGAFQLVIMYGFYYQSFLYLSVPELLLFSVLTPIYVTLINCLFAKQFNPGFIFSARGAVLGAVAIR